MYEYHGEKFFVNHLRELKGYSDFFMYSLLQPEGLESMSFTSGIKFQGRDLLLFRGMLYISL